MENEISSWFQSAVGSQMVWTVKEISSSGGFKNNRLVIGCDCVVLQLQAHFSRDIRLRENWLLWYNSPTLNKAIITSNKIRTEKAQTKDLVLIHWTNSSNRYLSVLRVSGNYLVSDCSYNLLKGKEIVTKEQKSH